MLQTPKRRQKQTRDEKIRASYDRLIGRGAMKTAAIAAIAKKFKISPSTVKTYVYKAAH